MRSFLALSLAFFIASLAPASYAKTGEVVTIMVVGNGETVEAARVDAIRQATTQVIGQTTVAERKIKDNDVLYDRVLSTVNGFVASFDVLSMEETGLGWRVSAEIGVSTSRIRSFIGIIEPGFARVDGGGLFAEQSRKQEQYAALGAMFNSLFRTGFPANHIETHIVEVGFEGADQVEITFETSLSPEFLSALRAFYEEVGYARCDTVRDSIYAYQAAAQSPGMSRRQIADGFDWGRCVPLLGHSLSEARELVLEELKLTPGFPEEYRMNGGFRPGHCFYTEEPEPSHYCYFLPEGDYMRALTEARDALQINATMTNACATRILQEVHGDTPAPDANVASWFGLNRLLFMIAPKRSDGSIAVKNGRPLIWGIDYRGNLGRISPHLAIGELSRTGVTFHLTPHTEEAVFAVSEIDVSDVQTIEILPTWGYMPDLIGTLEEIGPLPDDACDRTLDVVKAGTSAVFDRLRLD